MIKVFEDKETKGLDPLYKEECIIGKDAFPDRMISFKLSKHPELSYSIYIDDINNESLYEAFKFFNDYYHNNGGKEHVLFCSQKTIFMLPTLEYVDILSIKEVYNKLTKEK